LLTRYLRLFFFLSSAKAVVERSVIYVLRLLF
jgi:hypothetical protein